MTAVDVSVYHRVSMIEHVESNNSIRGELTGCVIGLARSYLGQHIHAAPQSLPPSHVCV